MVFGIHLPSTLSKGIEKPNLAKLVPALAVISPVGFVAYEIAKNPDKVKSTLGDIGEGVKKAAPVVATTIGKGAHAVAGVASAGFNTIMMPLMVVGGLVVAMMVLKK